MKHLLHSCFIKWVITKPVNCGWKYLVIFKWLVVVLSKLQQVVSDWHEPSDTARHRLMSQLGSERGKAKKWRAHRHLLESQRGTDGQIGRRKQEVKAALIWRESDGAMVRSEDKQRGRKAGGRRADRERIKEVRRREKGTERRGNWKKMMRKVCGGRREGGIRRRRLELSPDKVPRLTPLLWWKFQHRAEKPLKLFVYEMRDCGFM